MTPTAIDNAWYGFVTGFSSASPLEVIFADQDAPRPPVKPFITIKVISGPSRIFQFDDFRRQIYSQNFEQGGSRQYTVSFNCYGVGAQDILGELQTLILGEVANRFLYDRPEQIAITQVGNIQNLTDILEARREEHYQFDVLFTALARVEDDTTTVIETAEVIEDVDIHFEQQYPPLYLATDVWHFGKAVATDNYKTEILREQFLASGDIDYGVVAPAGMRAVRFNNDVSGVYSHLTSPGILGASSVGHVNASYQPLDSSFYWAFHIRSLKGALGTKFILVDYDMQDSAVVFKPGYQIFVDTAGVFAPASLGIILYDDALDHHEARATFGELTIFEDEKDYLVEVVADRNLALPTFLVNGIVVASTKVSGVDLDELSDITPTGGMRFGAKEYDQTVNERAHIEMAGAAFANNLDYRWPYWEGKQ